MPWSVLRFTYPGEHEVRVEGVYSELAARQLTAAGLTYDPHTHSHRFHGGFEEKYFRAQAARFLLMAAGIRPGQRTDMTGEQLIDAAQHAASSHDLAVLAGHFAQHPDNPARALNDFTSAALDRWHDLAADGLAEPLPRRIEEFRATFTAAVAHIDNLAAILSDLATPATQRTPKRPPRPAASAPAPPQAPAPPHQSRR